MTTLIHDTSINTRFVPAELDPTDWSSVEALYAELENRPLDSADGVETWLEDWGELRASIDERQADLYIASSCNTKDESADAAYRSFVETIPPKVKPIEFRLQRRAVEALDRLGLAEGRLAVLHRNYKAAVELFREENVPIQTELAKLSQDAGKVTGSMTVQFDGEEKTLPQMAVYQQQTDRAVRERAWAGVAQRRLQDRDTLDGLYNQMIAKRDLMANNAGLGDFVDYCFVAMQRFDYTKADCRGFWEGVEKSVVPLMRRLDERRRERLGVETLRPWDLAVDPAGRGPLKPFDGGRELYEKTGRVFDALDGRLAGLYRESLGVGVGDSGDKALVSPNLDLDTRSGKRPGGYQYERARTKRPFIFMNAAGLHRDAMTMVHEAGHAFHSVLCSPEKLLEYRDYPIEFAEVASMSMEMLTMPHWDAAGGFYTGGEDVGRARREHLESAITILAWIATIDAFQHWIYANPTHSRDERTAFWLSLDARFGHAVSWEGHEDARAAAWQRQGHLYDHALYYIEYGIAQLGALQLWTRSRNEGEQAAVNDYIEALRLGGSKPLPQLFEAAGIRFDMGPDAIARVTEEVERELDKLPD